MHYIITFFTVQAKFIVNWFEMQGNNLSSYTIVGEVKIIFPKKKKCGFWIFLSPRQRKYLAGALSPRTRGAKAKTLADEEWRRG